jgi:hypothetical protein
VENFDSESEYGMRQILTRSPSHELSMSSNSELKSKITNWILEEGATCSQAQDENVEFRLHVTWGYVVDVVKEKGFNRIINSANLGFQEEKVVKAFTKLSKKEKREFFFDLQTNLAKFPIGYTINPNTLERLDSVVFSHTVYVEDLTKTALMESIDLIRRSMHFTSVFATNKLEIDLTSPNTSDSKAGVA